MVANDKTLAEDGCVVSDDLRLQRRCGGMVKTYRRTPPVKMKLDADLAMEAKARVVLAFRNGPIEDLHAGKSCPVCSGMADVSHISDDEMKLLLKSAVNAMYRLLWQRDYDPIAYNEALAFGRRNTIHWDDPELKTPREGSRPK